MSEQKKIQGFSDEDNQSEERETVRLKHLADINPTKSEISELNPETEVSFVALEDFGTDGEIKNTETRALSEVYEGYTYFREGDIAVAKITPSFENGKGAICQGLTNGIGFGTTELHILRPLEGVSREFLWYILRSKPFMDEAETAMRGVAGQQRVPTQFIENFTVPHFPEEYQENTVPELDNNLQRIDNLINASKRMSVLIKERADACVRSLVFGERLDCGKYKDTDLPWTERVPSHWRISKIKFELQNFDSERIPLSASERAQHANNYPYYGASGVIDEVEDYLFDGKYVLIGEDGENLRSRSKRLAFIAEGQFWPNNHVHILKPYDGDERYFAELLESLDYKQYVEGAAQPKLTAKELSDIQIPVPPYNEQQLIAKRIKDVRGKAINIDGQISKMNNALKEKRQALITDAVTGQFDVSNV